MPEKSVQALLDDIRLLDGARHTLVESVQALVETTISPLCGEVKYGGILFSSGVQFCGVFAYQKHVSIEFGSGAKISDPLGFLEGSGKGRRHIKLYSVDDIQAKNLALYLRLAWESAKTGA